MGEGDVFQATLIGRPHPDGTQPRMAFEAPGELTLLEAMELAGIDLPSSCRNGTCRTCLSPTRSGSVRYEIDWPGLSAEEKAEGWVLPCVAHATSDLVLENGAARQVSPR